MPKTTDVSAKPLDMPLDLHQNSGDAAMVAIKTARSMGTTMAWADLSPAIMMIRAAKISRLRPALLTVVLLGSILSWLLLAAVA